MIKDIEELKELGFEKACSFLRTCRVYEKIDMFYFKVKIVSKNSVEFYKSNGKLIKPEDIILSKMWREPIEDLSKVILTAENLQDFVGYTFGFFFLPCEKPLKVSYSIAYNNGFKYFLNDVFFDNKKLDFVKDERFLTLDFNELFSSYLVSTKGSELYLNKFSADVFEFNENYLEEIINNAPDRTYKDMTEFLIWNFSYKDVPLIEEDIVADEKPEGYIFKNGNDIYQIIFKESEVKFSEQSKLGMELTILNFCKWIKTIDYGDLITASYVESVCNLFEKYLKYGNIDEKYYHITPEELEAPTFGYYAGTCYEFIPNKFVREVCMSNKLYENIFKILLNGLRRQKLKNSYQLINIEAQAIWNSLVKTIQISTMGDYSSLISLNKY